MLDGFDFTFMGNDVLFSMNDDASIKGIQMNGWLMNVYGSMHSNSNIEANCSVITVNGDCSSVAGSQFNTWQTILENDPVAWERLLKCTYYESDILLLEHELFEATYYNYFNPINGCTLREAHEFTTTYYD